MWIWVVVASEAAWTLECGFEQVPSCYKDIDMSVEGIHHLYSQKKGNTPLAAYCACKLLYCCAAHTKSGMSVAVFTYFLASVGEN